jgi:hypothetical protein
MHRTILAIGALGLLATTSCAFAEDAVIKATTDRVSLFEVPFRCPVAPQIGCGSMSKPILLELERDPSIGGAWLNRTGTVLAVVWSEAEKNESTLEAAKSIFEKNGVPVNELAGNAYTEQLKSFTTGTDWYRGPEVDALSKIEARTIALRMVHRVQATVTVAPEKAEALEAGIASVFEHRFTGTPNDAGPICKREQLTEDISAVARANLDEKGIAALEAAFAKGVRHLPEDNEATKSKSAAPQCCNFSPKS